MKNFEIGIDLGTTNSEVAVMQNGNVEIIANAFGDFYTPSVVGINKAHNIVVGKRAFEALNRFASSDELLNNKAEIKRLMGTATAIKFSRTNKTYLPEEISAEILKSLRADVLSKYPNINVDAVVITIPAHFSTVQAEATKRAGLLAGFSNVLLLQEPIAAAISYGFNKNLNENWLVYDLGGGTFDVALISSKDGDLKVLEHNGDNFLGGKDLDLAIIDEFVVPYIRENFNLHDFSRGYKKYKAIFSKLKYSVEQAKVMLSRMEKAEIECDFCVDGKDIFDTIILTQNDLEKIATPLIKKTIALCNETIKTSGIDKKNIDRIILVGGSTQLDCLRKQLKDSLDIYVDMSTNPLTAVAVGACIYASGQQMEDIPNSINENLYKINVYFEALSAEKEELIVGELPDFQDTSSDFYIQIRNVSNTFNSGKLKLTKGKFKLYVPLEAKKLNQFFIDLFDNLGNSLTLSQNSITIIQGLNICAAPLPKSVGISFFEEDFFTKEKRNIPIFLILL